MRAVRRDVESLAAMERRSASPGERGSAQWVAGRLRAVGAHDVRLQSFRYQHTFGHAHGIHSAAGLVGAAIGGRVGRALAAGALVSIELELSGRRQWIRRLLPAGEGTNVVARVAARGEARRTLVLVAHHDAAHTGLMLGMSAATLSRVESGKHLPERDRLLRLADWAGMPLGGVARAARNRQVHGEDASTVEAVELHLGADKNLDPDDAEMIVQMVRTAYDRMSQRK